MKRLLILITILHLSTIAFSQINTPYVKYIYDAAGNRTTRLVIVMKSADATTDTVQTPEPVVDMLNEMKILLYPNPTTGILRVDIQNSDDSFNAEMMVYSMDGKLLSRIHKISHSQDIDFSRYPMGIYLVQLTDGKSKREWEIVKQ